VVISVPRLTVFKVMKNPKEFIIDEYRKHGSPISLESFYAQYREVLPKGVKHLSELEPLDNVFGLTLDQANELINFYGEGSLFSSEIERNAREYVATREKLDFIEKKK